jgi:hypothetical protein
MLQRKAPTRAAWRVLSKRAQALVGQLNGALDTVTTNLLDCRLARTRKQPTRGAVRNVVLWYFSDKPTATKLVAYWTNIRQGPAHGLIGSALNDPSATLAVAGWDLHPP